MLVAIAFLVTAALVAALLAGRQWARQSRWETRSTAAKAERARLAREMHDSLSKTLDALALGAAALPSTLDAPDRAARLAHSLHEGSLMAARDARAIIDGLRARPADAPLEELLNAACHEWTVATGVPVELTVAPGVGVHPDLVPDLVEIVREALRNIAVHAEAQRVSVSLAQGKDVALSVTDDGRGVAGQPPPGRYGLLGMAERARLAGGKLEVKSRPGGGTAVIATFPGHVAPAGHPARMLAASAAVLTAIAVLLALWGEPLWDKPLWGEPAGKPVMQPPPGSQSPSTLPSILPSVAPSPSVAQTKPSRETVVNGRCRVGYTIREQWDNGFTADLTITNLDSKPVNGWTLVFTFDPNQKLLSVWDATAGQNGKTITVSDGGRKTVIPAGGTISFGMQGTWKSVNPVPSEFLLNQRRCIQ